METESALYQLMGVRRNGVTNDITNSDGKYQEIIWKSDECSGLPLGLYHNHIHIPRYYSTILISNWYPLFSNQFIPVLSIIE